MLRTFRTSGRAVSCWSPRGRGVADGAPPQTAWLAGLLAAAFATPSCEPGEVRNFSLVGVLAAGAWVDQDVLGGLSAAAASGLPAARPVLRAGQAAYFQLRSADVVHSFYAPELGIGPLDVVPGREVVFAVRPQESGVYRYYCNTMCGDQHYAMTGEILVLDREEPAAAAAAPPPPVEPYWLVPAPGGENPLERGRWLFERLGCQTCHGSRAGGGVPNENSAGGFVPALDALAERLELFEPEEAEAFSRGLLAGEEPESIADYPSGGDLERSAELYRELVELLRNGRETSRKLLEGPRPPLDMPAWGSRLDEPDIRQIVAYLISLQDWGEE